MLSLQENAYPKNAVFGVKRSAASGSLSVVQTARCSPPIPPFPEGKEKVVYRSRTSIRLSMSKYDGRDFTDPRFF